ncbi:MAG TPA: hypothetical protein VIG62_00310 [Blastocatellia bacterium]|jgi:peptidoglycan hydrolase CwlO-like protein
MSDDDPTKQAPTADRIEELISLVQGMNQEVKQVRSEVADLKQTVDSRLRETRPIWEAVQSRLDDISEDLGNVDRKLDVLHGDVLQVRADQKRLNDRVDRLEK